MALTIRERLHTIKQRGTLLDPLPFEIHPGGSAELHTWLGYDAAPATDFWRFSVRRQVQLRVIRRSDDPLVVHVAVALLDRFNHRVCSLVDTHDGIGAWHTIGPGVYTVVASLGMPLEMPDVRLTIEMQPLAQQYRGVAGGIFTALLQPHLPRLKAIGLEPAPIQATLLQPTARALATGDLFGRGVISTAPTSAAIAVLGDLGGHAFMHGTPAGVATMFFNAAARLQAAPQTPAPQAATSQAPGPQARFRAHLAGQGTISIVTRGRLRGIADLQPFIAIRRIESMRGIADLGPSVTASINSGIDLPPAAAALMRRFRQAGTGWHRLQGLSHMRFTAQARLSPHAMPAGTTPPCCDGAPQPGSSTLPVEEIKPCP